MEGLRDCFRYARLARDLHRLFLVYGVLLLRLYWTNWIYYSKGLLEPEIFERTRAHFEVNPDLSDFGIRAPTGRYLTALGGVFAARAPQMTHNRQTPSQSCLGDDQEENDVDITKSRLVKYYLLRVRRRA